MTAFHCTLPYGGGNNTTCTPDSVPTPVVTVPSAQKVVTSDLPFTGGDVVGLSLVGVVLVALGLTFMRRARNVRTGFISDPYFDAEFEADDA